MCISYECKKKLFEFLSNASGESLQVYFGIREAISMLGLEEIYTAYSIAKAIRNKHGMEKALEGESNISVEQIECFKSRLNDLLQEEFSQTDERSKKKNSDFRFGFSLPGIFLGLTYAG